MSRLPYRILFLCVFLPPVLYVFTIQGMETYLQRHESGKVHNLLISDMDAILQGRETVQEEIRQNLERYLRHDWWSRLGVQRTILVRAGTGTLLYPPPATAKPMTYDPKAPPDPLKIAARNYQLLESGLKATVTVRVRHNAWLSNLILLLYVGISLLVLLHFVKKAAAASRSREQEREKRIQELNESLEQASAKLHSVAAREAEYRSLMEALKKEKKELSRDVDGLLEEMERLENGLEKERQTKEKIEQEMENLRGELEALKGETSAGSKKKRKKIQSIQKRFKVLYKNLHVSDRAIQGFLSLPEDFQLKAEELLSRLNQDASGIQVRRKVFGKGGKKDILETDFSYSGRLYFRRDSSGGVDVLAIGTKNSQVKDLSYLESVDQ